MTLSIPQKFIPQSKGNERHLCGQLKIAVYQAPSRTNKHRSCCKETDRLRMAAAAAAWLTNPSIQSTNSSHKRIFYL